MIKEDWHVINLAGADVDVFAGPDVEPGAEGHRKRSFVSVRTGKVVVAKISVVARHAEERVRIRNERRRVAPVETWSTQQQIPRNARIKAAAGQGVSELGIGYVPEKFATSPTLRCTLATSSALKPL